MDSQLTRPRRSAAREIASLAGQISAVIYGVGLLLYIAALFTPLQSWRIVDFVGTLVPLVLLPLPLLLLVAILRRHWLVLAALALPTLYFGGVYAPLFVPRTSEAATDATLRVATWNLYGRETGFEPVLGVIRRIDADVIALQEVSMGAANVLEGELATQYPFRAMHPVPGNEIAGQALLSKFPITEDQFWMMGLGQQRSVLTIGTRRITVFNLHPPMPFGRGRWVPYNPTARDQVVDDALGRAANDPNPIVLLGDFNLTDANVPYRRVTERFVDAWRVAGFGLGATWPALWDEPDYPKQGPARFVLAPVSRIDYVFHSPSIRTRQIRVWPYGAGSDHRPVVADLALP
jgi:vancomycin resistance protein VanJ